MNTTERSQRRRCLLSDIVLCADNTVLLDGSNIGVGPQILELGRRESTSEAIDDGPLMGDRGGTVDPARECVDVGFTAGTVLEGDDVSPGNGLLGLLHRDKGRRSGESREDAESEDDEILGEHVDNAGWYRRGGAEAWR